MATIRLSVCVAFLLSIHSLEGRADDEFPYEAYVAADGAEVVSGPGHRYYATARLRRGTKIEIYREETSGWLAIRPPEGSFSWVPAEFIERSEDDETIGRAIEPTPAWVGTAAERVREHREQVTLKAGEVVQILGEKQVAAEGDEEETWLKIAPPAGEFRWIHLRDVSRTEPPPIAEPREPARVEPAQIRPARIESQIVEDETDQPQEVEEPRRFEVPRSAIALRDLESAASRQAREADKDRMNPRGNSIEAAQYRSTSEAASKSISPDGFVPRKRRGSEQLQPVPVPSERLASRQNATFTKPRSEAPALVSTVRQPTSTSETVESSAAAANTAAQGAAIENVARKLEQLDVELSLALSEDKSSGKLAELRQRVEELVERGSDPVARGQARLLLDKIKRFEETFSGDDLGPIASPASRSTGDAVAASSPATAPRYDGSGWLKPVVSRRGDKPVAPYALVDADGKPVCFVTPSPGMNLSPYVNKQVGVYGRRGYIESLKTAHVTTQRVIDLERQLR